MGKGKEYTKGQKNENQEEAKTLFVMEGNNEKKGKQKCTQTLHIVFWAAFKKNYSPML